MEKTSAGKIEELVSKFSDKSFPKSQWTHQAHVLVAIWHNFYHDFDTALNMVGLKIKAYNAAVGTLNTENSGYHQTLTIFWMVLTKSYLLANPSLRMEEACHNFLISENASKNTPLKYYSKDFLFSKEARRTWVNGDLQKISLCEHGSLNGHTDLSDGQFEREFHDCTLPPTLFCHEAHIRIAWVHIHKYGVESAIENICGQLTAYVAHVGAKGKYNTTLTIASVKMIDHFMRKSDTYNFTDFIQEFPQLKSNFKGLIGSHYAMDIFNSQEAKRKYIAPDLLPFE